MYIHLKASKRNVALQKLKEAMRLCWRTYNGE